MLNRHSYRSSDSLAMSRIDSSLGRSTAAVLRSRGAVVPRETVTAPDDVSRPMRTHRPKTDQRTGDRSRSVLLASSGPCDRSQMIRRQIAGQPINVGAARM
jgi:hypothetical protein